MRDRLVDLEELQPMTGKLLAEHIDHFDGESALFIPSPADDGGKRTVLQRLGPRAFERNRFFDANDIRQSFAQ